MATLTSRSASASLSRRQLMRSGIAAFGMYAMARMTPAAFGLADVPAGEVVVPFIDDLPDVERQQIKWHEPLEWVTPNNRLFDVAHYGYPNEIDQKAWTLTIGGLVDKPITLTLDQLKALPRKEITATIECSGNGSNPNFMGAIGNGKWAGASLADLLKQAGVKPGALEVAFYGTDTGKETLGKAQVEQAFARTLPISEIGREDLLLCYERNGEPLKHRNGAPVRLIVPGWYGIAWVKWLSEIEVRDRRLMTRFMAKDYVTLRGEKTASGKVRWKQTSVGPMNVKSIAARVTKRPDGTHVISGAAWTQGKVKKVEVQIDTGEWAEAKLTENDVPNTWTFWSYEWKDAKPGEHTLVSRATDEKGRIQPTKEDPEIAMKKTYYESYAQFPRKVKV